MDSLNKFSLREILGIITPGVFFIFSILPIISEIVDHEYVFEKSNLNIILISISSFFTGIIIYTIDIPKNISFFNNATPTKQFEKKIKSLNLNVTNNDIHNTYFDFYDKSVSSDQKAKIERLTGMYHFSMNIFFSSIMIILVYLVSWFCTETLTVYLIPVILVGILSLVSALGLFYGKRKIRYYFNRQFNSFKKSEEYKSIIDNL